MKKFILYISIPLMLAMLACTDYSGEIESAYDEFNESLNVNNTGIPCGDVWCGPLKDTTAHIGKSVGSIYAYVDHNDGGVSNFLWSTGETGVLTSSAIESMDKTIFGIAGNYVLEEKTVNDDGYLGVSFDLGGIHNLWEWPGLCVVYYSTSPLWLQVYFPDAEDTTTYKWAMPRAKLPATTSGTYEVYDVAWSSFDFPKWSKYKGSSLEYPLSTAAKIELKFQTDLSEFSGNFVFYSIGRHGSCK